MSLFIFSFFENKKIESIIEISSKLPVAFLLICLVYAIGIIIDRLLSKAFDEKEKKAKAEHNIDSDRVTFLVWKKHGREDDYNFRMSRKRILRASIVNVPLIVLFLCINLFIRQYTVLAYCLLAIGAALTYATIKSFWIMNNDYYSLTERLIKESQRSTP